MAVELSNLNRPHMPKIGERASVLPEPPAIDVNQFFKGFCSAIAVWLLACGAVWAVPAFFRAVISLWA